MVKLEVEAGAGETGGWITITIYYYYYKYKIVSSLAPVVNLTTYRIDRGKLAGSSSRDLYPVSDSSSNIVFLQLESGKHMKMGLFIR
eukprot:scaffold135320_cov30-Tisochrysis_lutea.AAC.2